MKRILRRHRRIVIGAALALAAALIIAAAGAPSYLQTSATARMLPIYSVQRDDKCVSLTFDAAWGNEDTQTLIDILGRYGVRATFFVVGAWAEKYPESVKALADAGHEVMTHSDDHAHFSALSAGEIAANIDRSCDRIEAITGARPSLFRAPYGEYDDHVIAAVESMGLRTIQWDVDSLDWKGIPADEIVRRVTGKIGSGSIVLFHNAAEHTPEALPEILDFLLQNGYRAVPVSELLLTGDYEIDNTGRMCRPKTT